MAKRPRFSRWRRLPPVFRTGEHRPIGSENDLDRIILYLPSRLLDLAERLAERAGVPAVQDYCSALLARAIESERVQQKVAGFEARRGPLQGLKEVADDVDYLAEWQTRSDEHRGPATTVAIGAYPPRPSPALPPAGETITVDLVLADGDESLMEPPPEHEADALEPNETASPDAEAEAEAGSDADPGPIPNPNPVPVPIATLPRSTVRVIHDRSALEVLWRHVGMDGDEWGFLPCLRRGVPVPANKAAELIRALNQLESEHRGADTLDRRMAHALHRLALESQVLLTDAWPGAFDDRVVAAIRSVQEAVERVLSGRDIRYYPNGPGP